VLPFQGESVVLPFQGESVVLPFQGESVVLPFQGESSTEPFAVAPGHLLLSTRLQRLTRRYRERFCLRSWIV
jgi:hypothetical protein